MEEINLLEHPISGLEQIRKLIPHREPMIMVDALEFFSESKAIATLTISKVNVFVMDDVFSETGLLEHMAQTAALHVGFKQTQSTEDVKDGYIASIKSSEIKRLPKCNEVLRTEMTVLYNLNTMTLVSLRTTIHNELIATAQMSTILNDKS